MMHERDAELPPVGAVKFGDLRRLAPISRAFGGDRGLPIDRYYIEQFLERHRNDIHGRTLELADDGYTRRYGGEGVERADVLNVIPGNPATTIVADLVDAPQIASNSFDCMIFTQALQFIYDAQAAVATIHRILKPGGVVLASFPVLSQICRYDMDRWGDYWRFTTASISRLFGDVFGPEQIEVTAYGNVLAAISFLQGLAAEELEQAELDVDDPDYQLVITARAVKRANDARGMD